MHECEGEVEPTLHAPRVALHLAIRRLGQPDPNEQLLTARAPIVASDPVHRGLQPQMLAPCQKRIERGLLQGCTDHPADLRPLLDDVVARNSGGAGCRRQQRRQHVDGGGLPGAVRTEEAVDLTRIDMQLDAVDGTRTLLELANELVRLNAVLAGGVHAPQATRARFLFGELRRAPSTRHESRRASAHAS